MGFGSTEMQLDNGMKIKGGDMCPACNKDTVMYDGIKKQAICNTCRAVFDTVTGKQVQAVTVS